MKLHVGDERQLDVIMAAKKQVQKAYVARIFDALTSIDYNLVYACRKYDSVPSEIEE